MGGTGVTDSMVSQSEVEELLEETAPNEKDISALVQEQDAMLADLAREMEENEKQLAALRPRFAEQESLKEELDLLRQERWQLQQLDELESVKELVARHGGQAEAELPTESGNQAAEQALQEMRDLEKELDAEMEQLRIQLDEAKQTERTFFHAKQELLQELEDMSFAEEDLINGTEYADDGH